MSPQSRERALISELKESLTRSLALPEVLTHAQGLLFQLLKADHVAWCVSRPGRASDYEWVVTERLAAFLARYPEMAGDDFVHSALAHQSNVVLRDSEMAPREVLERSRSYRLCRELGIPLEHVMSVKLDMNQDWHGGLTVYREQLRPFSEREQKHLQSCTPVLVRTVRNCRMFNEVAMHGQFPELLLRHRKMDCLVLTPKGREEMRTDRVTALLEDWFSPSELGPSGLPREWLERLAWLVRLENSGHFGLDLWERRRQDRKLRVTFVHLPEQNGRRLWTLVLDTVAYPLPIPSVWRKQLTPRETEVTYHLLQNHDAESISYRLGISLHTARTHVKNIREKLRVQSREEILYQAALLYQAARE